MSWKEQKLGQNFFWRQLSLLIKIKGLIFATSLPFLLYNNEYKYSRIKMWAIVKWQSKTTQYFALANLPGWIFSLYHIESTLPRQIISSFSFEIFYKCGKLKISWFMSISYTSLSNITLQKEWNNYLKRRLFGKSLSAEIYIIVVWQE